MIAKVNNCIVEKIYKYENNKVYSFLEVFICYFKRHYFFVFNIFNKIMLIHYKNPKNLKYKTRFRYFNA